MPISVGDWFGAISVNEVTGSCSEVNRLVARLFGEAPQPSTVRIDRASGFGGSRAPPNRRYPFARAASNLRKVATVEKSARPSTSAGRKCR